MSAPRQPALAAAAAFRLLAHLDTYENDLRVFAEEWPCSESQAMLARQLDTMRSEATVLPKLIVSWLELLLSHERLIRSFTMAASTCERLDELEKHIGLVLHLQRECLDLLTGQPHLAICPRA